MIEIITTAFLIGLIFAPLGCIVMWKRYAYFGDGMAHASILAGVVSIILQINILLAGFVISMTFAILVNTINIGHSKNFATGVISSIFISFALVISAIFDLHINLEALLFGNIISSDLSTIGQLLVLLITVLIFYIIYYKQLLLIILSRDIAYARGVNTKKVEFIFLTLLSLSILLTIKLVGALLVTSMIIMPAAIARIGAKAPLTMILSSIFISLLMNAGGLTLSLRYDIPFGPTIILSGALMLCVAIIIRQTRTA